MTNRRRILLAVLGGIVLILAGLFLYVFEFGGLEAIVSNRMDSLLGPHNLHVDIGRMSGNLFSALVLEDVTVTYIDSSHRFRLASFPRISTGYSISRVWSGSYALDYLYLDSAEISLVRDSAEGWLLPGLSREAKPAGEATLSQFSIAALGLNHINVKLLFNGDTVAFEDIIVSLALRGAEETYAVDVERFEFATADNRFQLDAAAGKLTYSNGNLLFKDLAIISEDTRIRLDGNVSLGTEPAGLVSFAADNVDLSDIAAHIGPRLRGVLDLNGVVTFEKGRLQGEADIGGDFMFASFENLHAGFHLADRHLVLDTLYGMVFGNCAIDGSGEIDFSIRPEQYRLDADIRNFDLRRLVASSFHSDLSGRISLVGESFKKRTMVLKINTELHESVFHDYHFHGALGDLMITTDSLVFVDSFRFDYFENVFYVSGPIDYDGELDLRVRADLVNLDRYRGKLFLEEPGGRGQAVASISGKTRDPDLHGQFVSDSLWLYGLFSREFVADAGISRFLTGKRGDVELRYLDGHAWSLPFDTLYGRLTVDSNLVRIDSVYLYNRRANVAARGLLDHQAAPMQLGIDSLSLWVLENDFYNVGELDIEIDSAGFDLRGITIGNNGSSISVNGRADYDEALDLNLALERIPVAPWLSLHDTMLAIDGLVSCRASVGGYLDEPRFEISGRVDSFTYRDLLLGDVTYAVRYRERLLTVDSLVVASDAGSYHAAGFLHTDLAFTADPTDRFPDLPMDIRIAAGDRRFDLVNLILPSVEQLDGEFSADFRLSGTPGAPILEGSAFIRDGRLKYFDLEDPIYTDSAGVTMRNNLVVVDRVQVYTLDEGKKDKKRYAYLQGELTFKSLENLHYNLDVSIPEAFPFSYELEDICGKIAGNLHVEGDSPPLVTGNLDLISMRYLVNFAEPDEGSPIMSALTAEHSWDLNLNMDILSNYWIKNDAIDAEFAGHINLLRERGGYRFVGEMEVLRGRGFLFDKTFQIEPGSRVIFEGDESLNARLDLTGTTHIAVVSQSPLEDEGSAQGQIKVGIHVTGTLETPEIGLVEDSDLELEKDDILPLIVANYYSSDDRSSAGGFEERITGVIGSQITQIGSKRLSRLGVETFEIDPYYQGEFDPLKARVTVGFYTASNLYVYGRSALSLQSGQEVGFEYRFNKSFLLDGRADEDGLYRLSLKLHWDF